MPSDDDIIIITGPLKKWWNKWIRFYDVILLGTEAAPVLKIRAWILFVIAYVILTAPLLFVVYEIGKRAAG